ncbi:hypothetical protein MLD38_035494 [Melastoma candidum]|uniref:Uncharacterized protein n=1 Tax=Melastoma candidum TaxID=119954 RepID=A0ACB9LII5_9MYRT|nr:hypothetical protein MLD38_035494 [Melastoma candidum]
MELGIILKLFNSFPFFAPWSWLQVLLAFASLIVVLRLVRPKPRCGCEICRSYLTLSWTKQHPNLCDWYAQLLENSPTKTIRVHVLGNIVTANPRNIEYMLKTRFDNYPKGKPFSAILGDFLGQGIFNVDGELWRFQKRMVSLELNRFSIRSYAFEIVRSEIDARLVVLLSSVASRNEVADLQDVFKRFSFDCICRFSFGLDPKCLELSLPISKFAASFDLASKLSAERAMKTSPYMWKLKRVLNMGSEKKLKEAINVIDILASEVIKQKCKIGISSDNRDLLSRFMVTVSDKKYLRDIIISFLLAGRDTVASALTCFFWILARNPDIRAKICTEADQVIRDRDLTSYEQLEKLHYLHAAVFESMRLYPPIQFDSKFCLEDDVLPDGTPVARGTRVTYHPYAMARIEEIWGKDCTEYRPERWLEDGKFVGENQYKYPVFQGGLRVCLGKEMAILEMKTVALSLLRRFWIELSEPNQDMLRFSSGLTATVRGGLRVYVRECASKPHAQAPGDVGLKI